jgi:hypothetical protein
MTTPCSVSVAIVNLRGFHYYHTAIYYAVPRVSDGTVTWRRRYVLEQGACRSAGKARRAAQDYAYDNGLPFDQNIRHGQIVPPEVAEIVLNDKSAERLAAEWIAASRLFDKLAPTEYGLRRCAEDDAVDAGGGADEDAVDADEDAVDAGGGVE